MKREQIEALVRDLIGAVDYDFVNEVLDMFGFSFFYKAHFFLPEVISEQLRQ